MRSHLDLVFLGDTHQLHRVVEVPPADVLIHTGDFTMFSQSLSAIADFNRWLGDLPHRHKLIVPGNHDFFLDENHCGRSLISNAAVLLNEEIEIEGLSIWGSPVTPLYAGAFGMSSPQNRTQHWAQVPEVDILVTHGPPRGILDRAPGHDHGGDPELLKAVKRVRPLVHAFGHIHGGYGQLRLHETYFVNCALLGQYGGIANRPVVLRIPKMVRPKRPRARQRTSE